MSSFELFGKVGLLAWEAKARDTTGGAPFSGAADGADVSFGIGASYNINRNLSVRAEWEQFNAVDTISLLSLGVVFILSAEQRIRKTPLRRGFLLLASPARTTLVSNCIPWNLARNEGLRGCPHSATEPAICCKTATRRGCFPSGAAAAGCV